VNYGGYDSQYIRRFPAYVIAALRGEALALLAVRPESSWLRDQATIIVGYTEAFKYYGAGEFPTDYIVEKLKAMRRIIVQAECATRRAGRTILP
jgi:hypothetical protein